MSEAHVEPSEVGSDSSDAPGFELVDVFRRAPIEMHGVRWSSDGNLLAACGESDEDDDGEQNTPSLVVWHASGDRPSVGLPGEAPMSLAWHPRRARLASANGDGTFWLHDLVGDSSRTFRSVAGLATGVAWSPDGKHLALTDSHGELCIWDVSADSVLRRTRAHSERCYAPNWCPDGRIVTSDVEGNIAVWSADDLRSLRRMKGHGKTFETTVSPDARLLACGSDDATVCVFDLESGREVAVLERHTNNVGAVRFTRDGEFLVSSSHDASLILWRCSDWEPVAVLNRNPYYGLGGLDFHPRLPFLAAKNYDDAAVECWQIDFELLRGRGAGRGSRRYVNAKVVLLGDTGVGKSGLGLVLSGHGFEPTESTHGRNVWVVPPSQFNDSEPTDEAREVLVWDLAGQPGYRMVHQLHLNEVAVALIVFDSRSEADAFVGVKHWARALAQARRIEGDSAVPVKSFLVAARADRFGVSVSSARVDAMVQELGFDDFFETSAKEDWNVPELRDAIRDAIAWESLPTVSSSSLLDSIRAFLLDEKQAGRVLATADDLFHAYTRAEGSQVYEAALRADFDAALGRVESRGLIRRLRFGDLVLLQPEFLDAYASALVQAAKSEPDGLGLIAEEDALAGRFRLSESERIANREQERLLLIATVEELLRHELALSEPTDSGVDLVFPSQFTRERPDAPNIPGRAVTIAFEGPLHNIYATLAVRLARSHFFERREMYRNAATYEATVGGSCGIYLRELEEGSGEIDVFFDDRAGTTVRRQFEAYVGEHLRLRAVDGTIAARRARHCPECGYVLPEEMIRLKLERDPDMRETRCPVCEKAQIALVDTEPRPAVAESVQWKMHESANAGRDKDVALARLKGKVETNDFDVFLCHNSADKPQVIAIAERLKEEGILPWLDIWEIPPGTRWQKELNKQLRKVRSAAVFVGARGPGPWQDLEMETLLQDIGRRKRPIIPVILPGRRGNPRLPGFLDMWHRVDMRVPDPDPFQQLIWGITGHKDSGR
jgi:WD40 repeat protein